MVARSRRAGTWSSIGAVMDRSVGRFVALGAVLVACGALAVGAWRATARPQDVGRAALQSAACSDTFAAGDWPRFGRTAGRSNDAPSGPSGVQLAHMRRLRITLPGTVDSSPILMRGIKIGGHTHDLLVVTTTYGRSLGIDAHSGRILWRYTPPGIAKWNGTSQITTASPVADPDLQNVYVASPDGRVHKLVIATGREIRSAGWPALLTFDPSHEKLPAALNLAGCMVFVATGGYTGDAPPYQGHLVALDRHTGHILHMFNTLCANRRVLIHPTSCAWSGSAIWGRAAPVIDPATGNLLIATGNGAWNGRTLWGDSVLELSPDAARLLQNYTPVNQAALNVNDADLGSTAPAVLPLIRGWHLAVQGGKDRVLRLLNLRRLNLVGGAGARTGGQLATATLPGPLFSAPAVVPDAHGALVLVGTQSSLSAFRVAVSSRPTLRLLWRRAVGSTSPVVAGHSIYAYDPGGSGLHVYSLPAGRLMRVLPAGRGHWSSPIVAAGVVALPEGDANNHASTGVLDLYR